VINQKLLDNLVQKLVYPLIIFAVIILLWQGISVCFSVNPAVLPSPLNILKSLVKNFYKQILPELIFTAKNILVGYLTALVVGFTFAAVCAQSQFLIRAISPIAVIFLLTPMMVLIPVFMVFLGFNPVIRIIVIVLQTSPIIFLNTLTGFTSITKDQKEFMAAYGCTRMQVFFKHTLFFSMPQIFSGMKLGTIISTIAAIGADFTMGKNGLGYRIKISSAMLRTDMVFATIFVAALLGIILFETISCIEQKVIVWKKK
jgi:NitT/TauT family transport system permease protein